MASLAPTLAKGRSGRPGALALAVAAAAVSALALASHSGIAAEIRPASLAEVPAALAAARPGDTVLIPDGTYSDQRLQLRAAGAEGRPVTLRAATPGKVLFSGKSSLEVRGAWLTVEGLVFDRCTVGPVVFRGTSHARLTACAVLKCNPDDDRRIHWIHVVGGDHSRVDHCYTEGKLKDGVVCVIDGEAGKMSTDNRIDHNHFRDVVRAVNNGMETIRVGTSTYGQMDSRSVVEENLFERCSGDAEVISSKSCGNTYRANTFVDCDGGLVMRHGHRSTVEGNFFFGGDHPRTAGIRVHGSDHRVLNNYLTGLGQFSISLPFGQSKFVPTGHEPTLRCVVAHNTIVDPLGPGILIGSDRSDLRDTAPLDLVFVNNLITGSRGTLVRDTSRAKVRWAGNVLFARGEAMAGVPGGEGAKILDPKLEHAPDGLWRPAAGSPLLGAGAPTPFKVLEDMDGQPRSGAADVGADQRATAPIRFRPLKSAEVGPGWMHARG